VGNEYASEIYVVTAIKDGVTEYWVAATTPKEAVMAVQLQAGPQWQVKVTDRRITALEAHRLKLRPGHVRRLR
jgi:hypothetical protein